MRRSSYVLAVFFLALPLFAQTPFPSEPWPIPSATPEVYWQKLMIGNATYVAGALPYTGLAARRAATAGDQNPPVGQNPPVTVLSCSDSRVPAELVFGRTVADIFVVRVAGNVASQFDIASIEYAIDKGWTKLIVVMGHEKCGAVEAALNQTDPGTPSLVALVQRIRESFVGWQTWPDTGRVERAVKANARSSAAYLLAHSTVIRGAVLDPRPDHRVGLVVAYYKLGSGQVEVVQP
jgi:carbonic anhydrase